MKIKGFEISSKYADIHPKLTELANPYFHKGNKIGVICMHGIACTPATLRPVIDALVKEGYTVDAPLIAGHGTTLRDLKNSHWTDWVKSIEASYDRLKKESCTKIFVTGLSLGGVLSAYLASEKERPCNGAVFFSPPFRMRNWLLVSMHLFPIFPYVIYPNKPITSVYNQGYVGCPLKSILILQHLILRTRRRMKNITCPYLAIWAALDDKVHPNSSKILKKLAVNAESGEEITMMKSYHSSTYGPECDKVAAATISFIKSHS